MAWTHPCSMRDHSERFTYNLYQYLDASNSRPPRVIRNDELSWLDV